MNIRVEFTRPASDQASAAELWWRANRPAAPDLFESELAAALEQLASLPLLAAVFAEVQGEVVRRVRLPRTRYALYFTLDGDQVTVHALWHGARGAGPSLP